MSLGSLLRRLARADDGAIAVEFAMIAVVLIASTVGAVETGRAVWVGHTLERATQEAARYAYTGVTDAQIEARLIAELTGLDSSAVTKSITTETVDGASYKTIQASYVFHAAAGMIPIKGTITRKTRVPL